MTDVALIAGLITNLQLLKLMKHKYLEIEGIKIILRSR